MIAWMHITHRAGGIISVLLSIVAGSSAKPPTVLSGIDVLERDGFGSLKGARVALITNQTGMDWRGQRTIDLLRGAEGVQLVRLFSPEHGLYGVKDEKVGDAVDP